MASPERETTEQIGAARLSAMYEQDRIKNWFNDLDDEDIEKLKKDLLVYFKNNKARADRAFGIISSYKAVDGGSAEAVMKEEDMPTDYTDI